MIRQTWNALTLVQPMASAIAWGTKRIENRPRRMIAETNLPLWLALHAGQKWSEEYVDAIDELDPNWRRDYGEVPQGAILGVVLVDWIREHPDHLCLRGDDRDAEQVELDRDPWAFGPWCMHIADVRVVEPIPARGALGLWTVDRRHWSALDAARDRSHLRRRAS